MAVSVAGGRTQGCPRRHSSMDLLNIILILNLFNYNIIYSIWGPTMLRCLPAMLLAASLCEPTWSKEPSAKVPSFPGAEGHGSGATGGRGGNVLVVDSLADDPKNPA